MIEFKIISKDEPEFYLKGTWDTTDYDPDKNDGELEYEQNDGTFKPFIPRYWKINGENRSFDFNQFIWGINFEAVRRYLLRHKDDRITLEFCHYFVEINGGEELQ